MKNSTIHTFYSTTPTYKLDNLQKNQGLQFTYKSDMPSLSIISILVIGVIFISLLDKLSTMAIVIAIPIFIGVYFMGESLKNQIMIFDNRENIFYKFNKNSKQKSEELPFSKIDSIQILHYKELSESSESSTSTDAYELNLVSKNKRVNIIAHSDHKAIQKDARRLARLLKVSIVNSKSREVG